MTFLWGVSTNPPFPCFSEGVVVVQKKRAILTPRTLGQEFHAYGNSVASDIDALSTATNRCFPVGSGQIIATSAEVTPNGGLVRESPQNPLNSGLGIILICPGWVRVWSMVVSGSPKRWDWWHSPSPNWLEKYHLYTTYSPCLLGGEKCYLPPCRGTRKNHWIDAVDGWEIPFPTTVWMMYKTRRPVVNNGRFQLPSSTHQIKSWYYGICEFIFYFILLLLMVQKSHSQPTVWMVLKLCRK